MEDLGDHTGRHLGSDATGMDNSYLTRQNLAPCARPEDLPRQKTPSERSNYDGIPSKKEKGKQRPDNTNNRGFRPGSKKKPLGALDPNIAPWDIQVESSDEDLTRADKIHHVPISLTMGSERSTSGETAEVFLSDPRSESEQGSRKDVMIYRTDVLNRKFDIWDGSLVHEPNIANVGISHRLDRDNVPHHGTDEQSSIVGCKPAALIHRPFGSNHRPHCSLDGCETSLPLYASKSVAPTLTTHFQTTVKTSNPNARNGNNHIIDEHASMKRLLEDFSSSADLSHCLNTSPTQRSTQSSPRKPKQPWRSPCLEDLNQPTRKIFTDRKSRKLPKKGPSKLASTPFNSSDKAQTDRRDARLAELLREVSSDFAGSEFSKSACSAFLGPHDGTQIGRGETITRPYLLSGGDGVLEGEERDALAKAIDMPIPERKKPWDKPITTVADSASVEEDPTKSRQHSTTTRSIHSSEAHSPAIEPRLWLRHRGASGVYYLPDAIQPLRDTPSPPPSSPTLSSTQVEPIKPTWRSEPDKVLLSFKGISERALYEVLIEVEVLLTPADTLGWQRLNIPRLAPRTTLAKDTQFCSFSFYMKPANEEHMGNEAQFDTTCLTEAVETVISVFGTYDLDKPLFLGIRKKVEIYVAPVFNTASETYITMGQCNGLVPCNENYTKPGCSCMKSSGNQIRVTHTIQLTTELLHKDIFTNFVAFTFILRHSRLFPFTRTLEPGECQVVVIQEPSPPRCTSDEITVVIKRAIDDIDKELHLCFTNNYSQKPPFTLRLPIIRPKLGDVLDGSIILCRPAEPLLVAHIPPGPATSWRLLLKDQRGLRFERLEMPRLFPMELQDNVLIRVTEVPAVSFADLQNFSHYTNKEVHPEEYPFAPVKNAKYWIGKVLGGGLQCRLWTEMEVGLSSNVLKINPKGWIPAHAFINGRLSTEADGGWRKTEDDFLTLFKSPQILSGDVVQIQVCFHHGPERALSQIEADANAQDRGGNSTTYDTGVSFEWHLPIIVSKTILNASVKCTFDSSLVTVCTGLDPRQFAHALFGNRRKIALVRLVSGYSLMVADLSLPEIDDDSEDGSVKDTTNEENLIKSPEFLIPVKPVTASPRKLGPGVRVRFADEEPRRDEGAAQSASGESMTESEMLQEVEIFPEDFGACEERRELAEAASEEENTGGRMGWAMSLIVILLAGLLVYFVDPEAVSPLDDERELEAAFDRDAFLTDDLVDGLRFDISSQLRSLTTNIPWANLTALISGLWNAENGGSFAQIHEIVKPEATVERARAKAKRPDLFVDENSQRTRVVGEDLDFYDDMHMPPTTEEAVEETGEVVATPKVLAKIWTWRDRIDHALGWEPVGG